MKLQTQLHYENSISAELPEEERQSLYAEISLLRTRILHLEHKADTDPLVPVYNRRAFIREIKRAQTMMSRYDILSSIIFFDLNSFKEINDKYGHGIGDEVLISVGTALQNAVRDCDMVARIGGDEFGVLLFKSDPLVAQAKAASLSCHIARLSETMPKFSMPIGAAWGVSACHPQDTPKQILDRADRAMFDDKQNN